MAAGSSEESSNGAPVDVRFITMVSCGRRAATPPGGSRGEPVTKRSSDRCSVTDISQSTSTKCCTVELLAV